MSRAKIAGRGISVFFRKEGCFFIDEEVFFYEGFLWKRPYEVAYSNVLWPGFRAGIGPGPDGVVKAVVFGVGVYPAAFGIVPPERDSVNVRADFVDLVCSDLSAGVDVSGKVQAP